MSRRLILVKHSMPVLEPGIPSSQWQLSNTGKQRCTVLAQHLAAYQPFQLYSSLEPKAVQTAELIAGILGVDWHTYPGLHEHERPQAGLSSQKQFHENVRRFFEQPTDVIFGTESADQAYLRFATALNNLAQDQSSTRHNLVVVTHGTVLTLFVSRRCGLPAYPFWEQLGLPSFIELDFPIELNQHGDVGQPIHIFNPYHPGAPV